MERHVRFDGDPPGWDAIKAALAQVGEAAPLRMIDNLPAFPDESPEPGWKELRVGVAGGMVTLRQALGGFACVVWGNAAGDLKSGWDRLCWAAAAAGGGTVDGQTADQFAAATGVSPA